jgi:hypothetical protein
MSSVHNGVDAWLGAAVDEPASDADAGVDEADPFTEVTEPDADGELIGVLAVPCVPDPAGLLEHPASPAPAISARAIRALLRIIDLPYGRAMSSCRRHGVPC